MSSSAAAGKFTAFALPYAGQKTISYLARQITIRK
jgi:hypothetical protein